MDKHYFMETVFEKLVEHLREGHNGIVLELSNGNLKQFTQEDIRDCSLEGSVFCIGGWCFDIEHIIGIYYGNPIVEENLTELREALGLYSACKEW